MASLLPVTIKKEDDFLPRPSIIPKRKAVVNIPPRARFAKARPNIGGILSKASKETQPPETEKKNIASKEDKGNETKQKSQVPNTEPSSVNANSQVPESESITTVIKSPKKEPGIVQRPKNRPTGLGNRPTAPRARYQKACPNISALANKAPKTGNSQREVGSQRDPVSANEKENIADSTALKKSNTVIDGAKESVLQQLAQAKPTKNVEPVTGFSFSKGEIEVYPEVSPDKSTLLLNDLHEIDLTGLQSTSDIHKSTVTESFTNETETFVPMSVEVVNLEPDKACFEFATTGQEKKKSNHVKDLTKIISRSPTETSKDMPPLTPVANKVMEYPTLKSILNSPRKRATTKKVYERKRRLANLSDTPSRSEMTMTDLIYYNPTGEPMKVAKPKTCAVENLPADENTKPVEPEPEEEDDGSNPPVPKVIINENGEIIIDESSLVVRRKETIDTSIEAIIENDNTTYSSFRKKSSKQWTTKETSKFYKALSLVGTDFALMENIFCTQGKVTRSRRELKMKFKREEKLRLELVHRAMYETQTYDISILEDDPDDIADEQVDDVPETPVPKKRGRPRTVGNEKKTKRAAPQKKKSVYVNESGTDENDDAINDILNEDSCSRNSEGSADVLEVDPSKDSTSQSIAITRPQRTRKSKILTDFVTDNDDSEISDGCIEDSETITREDPPDCSENSDNGQSLTVKKSSRGRKRKTTPVLPTECLEPDGAQDINSPSEMECVDVSRLGRVRRAKILADFVTDEHELEENNESSDDESVKGVGKRRKLQVFDEDSDEECPNETEDNCIMVEQIDRLPDTATVEVIEKVKEEYEKSPELVTQQKDTEENPGVVFLAEIRSPRQQDPTNFRTKQSPVINTTDNSKNSYHNQSPAKDCNEKMSSILKLSPTFVEKSCDIPIQCIDLEQPNNILTDSEVSEVVITESTKFRRTRRRAATPNIVRGKQRQRPQVKIPHVQPSFSNFTPAEEQPSPPREIDTYSRNIAQAGLGQPREIKTYSRNTAQAGLEQPSPGIKTYSQNIIQGAQVGLPLEIDLTVSTDPSTSLQMSQTIHDPGSSFQNNQTTVNDPRTSFQNNPTTNNPGTSFQNNPRTNDSGSSFQNNLTSDDQESSSDSIYEITNPGTSLDSNRTTNDVQILDSNKIILDAANPSVYNQTILDPMASFPNSQAITLDSGSTDPNAPVMIFTKSPNNENILHLFMVSPKHTSI